MPVANFKCLLFHGWDCSLTDHRQSFQPSSYLYGRADFHGASVPPLCAAPQPLQAGDFGPFFVSLHGGGPFCLVYVPPKRQAGGPSARLLSEIQQLNRGGFGNCAIHRVLYQNLCSPLG